MYHLTHQLGTEEALAGLPYRWQAGGRKEILLQWVCNHCPLERNWQFIGHHRGWETSWKLLPSAWEKAVQTLRRASSWRSAPPPPVPPAGPAPPPGPAPPRVFLPGRSGRGSRAGRSLVKPAARASPGRCRVRPFTSSSRGSVSCSFGVGAGPGRGGAPRFGEPGRPGEVPAGRPSPKVCAALAELAGDPKIRWRDLGAASLYQRVRRAWGVAPTCARRVMVYPAGSAGLADCSPGLATGCLGSYCCCAYFLDCPLASDGFCLTRLMSFFRTATSYPAATLFLCLGMSLECSVMMNIHLASLSTCLQWEWFWISLMVSQMLIATKARDAFTNWNIQMIRKKVKLIETWVVR